MLDPAQIMQRLEEIEHDLALRQNEMATAGVEWFRAKRDKELAWARAYVDSSQTAVTDRKAEAILASAEIGKEAEATYTACEKVCSVLNTRAMIGMALLKAHGRIT